MKSRPSAGQDDPQILFITPGPGFKVSHVWGIFDLQQEDTKRLTGGSQ